VKKPYSAETLEILLQLDGEVFPMDNGFWTKFEAKLIEPGEHIPHGIKYSLTLHDSTNKRVMGFDNAHAYKPRKKKFRARKITWDHKHQREKILPYEFESAGQLLEDFWNEVDRLIKEME
jgi:hypothetical protein